MHICLFDIDGTLITTGGAGLAAFRAALVEAFNVGDDLPDIPLAGLTDRAIIRDLFTLFGLEDSAENWQRFHEAYCRHLPDSLATRAGRVLPGIQAGLAELAPREDLLVGLLTGNVREGARLKLTHYGLWQHFCVGAFGDDHLCREHVAEAAVANVEQHTSRPVATDRLWIIGDTPNDIRCARAVGGRAVAVATGTYTIDELAGEGPDLLLPDLSDWEPLLALWS